jgi:hypothetical protein
MSTPNTNTNTNTQETTNKDAGSSKLSTICIDLETVHAQTELKKDDLIQKHVYEALRSRITKRLEWVEAKTKGEEKPNPHDTYSVVPSGYGWVSFIDGTRGAGKSTFMHTALRLFREDFSKLAIIGCIDPSRIESSEILLLTLLHALKEKVEEVLKRPHQCEQDNDDRKKWGKAFHKVAGGLVMFQKDHHPLKELDEDLFLDIGLEQAGHSTKLRENLANLFEVACGLLNAKALLFAFDDADTNSKHAIALLEMIRNYLDTPRALVLLTGDLELYSLLVRQHFRHELARGKRDEWGIEGAAGGRATQQIRMLDHLEEQYLLKLFPLRERHHLFPLWRLTDDSGNRKAVANFEVSTKIENGQELKPFIRNLIQKGFRLTDGDTGLYTEYLLMQPIRSVLQVLSRLQEDESVDGNNQFGLAIQDLALLHFYHYNIAAEELAMSDFRTLVEAVFEVAMDDGDPDTSAYLRPSSAHPHNRGAMYGLSAAVAQQLRGKPSSCIAYLLRGPGMVKIAHDAANSNIRKLDEKVLLQEFKRYMGVGRNDDALGCARLATVALVSEHAIAHNQPVIRYGIVGLNQDSTSGYTGFRKVFAALNNIPAAAFSLVNSSGTGPRTFASIYNVLGLMGRLLEMPETQEWQKFAPDQKKKNIRRALSGFYPNTNSISVPPWIAITNTDNDKIKTNSQEKIDGDEGVDDTPQDLNEAGNTTAIHTQENVSIELWTDLLLTWLNATQLITPHIQPSSVFMGKVWPRLFFGLENISDALRPLHTKTDRDFATLMELFALCVINAFLAEESTHHLTGSTVDELNPIVLANPRSSAVDYLNRLSTVRNELSAERLPLTYIVATCPLITGLISEAKVFDAKGWPFILAGKNKSPAAYDFISDAAWEELTKVAVQGKKIALKSPAA